MGGSAVPGIRVPWTRAEIVAVREAIEVTPLFEGRATARDLVRSAMKSPRPSGVTLPADTARLLSERMVPTDGVTAIARVKLARAVRGTSLGAGTGTRAARRR